MSRTSAVSRERLRRRVGFTLVELLVVIAIIALLVGILIPSMTGARNIAMRASADSMMKNIATGLAVFKIDNEGLNPQTNGYPSSAAGEDTATPGTQVIYGAHWLVRSLAGKDLQGYIPRRLVPLSLQDRGTDDEQVSWYQQSETDERIERIAPYLPMDQMATAWTENLAYPPTNTLYPSASNPLTSPSVRHVPVFVDPWGSPVLYYAANTFGKTLCVGNTPGPKEYYNHADNVLFTGAADASPSITDPKHDIQYICPQSGFNNIDDDPSWAGYIHDHRIHEQTNMINNPDYKAKPVNPDSYLLISAGLDTRFGTDDDVNNFGE